MYMLSRLRALLASCLSCVMWVILRGSYVVSGMHSSTTSLVYCLFCVVSVMLQSRSLVTSSCYSFLASSDSFTTAASPCLSCRRLLIKQLCV